MAFSPLEAPQRLAIMLMQRVCMFIMAGYSSASDMFLEMFSNISCSAWVSMYVPTKLEDVSVLCCGSQDYILEAGRKPSSNMAGEK